MVDLEVLLLLLDQPAALLLERLDPGHGLRGPGPVLKPQRLRDDAVEGRAQPLVDRQVLHAGTDQNVFQGKAFTGYGRYFC